MRTILEHYQKGINSDSLLKTAISNISLFRDQNNIPHAITTVGSKKELICLQKDVLAKWLRRLFLQAHAETYGVTEIDRTALYLLSLASDTDIPIRPVFNRIGQLDGTINYDLGNGNVVSVTESCVDVFNNKDFIVCFNPTQAQACPNLNSEPEKLINLLRPFFRVAEDQLLLLVVYIVTCFLYDINHPILILHGSPGSSKSTTFDMLGKIIDPHNSANRLTMNPDRRSLVAALSHRYFLGFDNLDVALKKWQSDLLCNACTEGSEPIRVLYETNSFQEINIKGCVCLNGINVVATESDLLDRCILMELKRIPDNQFITEKELQSKFMSVLPDILGSIFNTLQLALATISAVKQYPRSRMQDFCIWGYCIADALGMGEEFTKQYLKNKETSSQEAKHPLIVECLLVFMRCQLSWSGKMTQLRDALYPIAKQRGYKKTEFPASASALSRHLNYCKDELEREGITYTQQNGGNRKLEILNQIK